MDANKMYWVKAWQELHKNATSSIEQILEVTFYKSTYLPSQKPSK